VISVDVAVWHVIMAPADEWNVTIASAVFMLSRLATGALHRTCCARIRASTHSLPHLPAGQQHTLLSPQCMPLPPITGLAAGFTGAGYN
jgi:hypothetical protein